MADGPSDRGPARGPRGAARLRTAARRLARGSALASAAVRTEGLLVSLQRARHRGPSVHVLLAAPGAGNIGDQAMLEAFCRNVPGRTVVLCRSAADYSLPADLTDRVDLVTTPGLLQGSAWARRAAAVRLARVLGGAGSVSVVGADIMDGHYRPHASLRRSHVARLAAHAGIPTAVLGFSWSEHPHPDAEAGLRRAAEAGVRLVVRDPVSHARLAAAGVPRLELAADMVFADTVRLPSSWSRWLDTVPDGRRRVLVNVSALVESRHPGHRHQVRDVVARLVDDGFAVLLVPHVSRPPRDDVALCAEVAAALASPHVRSVPSLLAPAEVRELAAQADLVVTGRMHLAVLALSQGTPAVVVETQGKTAGLMQVLGLGGHNLTPQEVTPDRVAALATGAALDSAGAVLRERLPAVVASAGANFAR